MNVVEFQHVTKRRKDFCMEDFSMTIPQGYITGFIGPNGSGKTTAIQLLMDILQLDAGKIQLFGTSHKQHEMKQHIGFVYDDLYMYEEFTIQKMKYFIAPLYEKWNEQLFQTYLERFDLPSRKKIKQFSKGMKMKCSLLFALSHEPMFILMDEPTSGLDPIFRKELLDILQQLMLKEKQTIFFSTHITTDLDRIADYIIFIDDGKKVFQKSMEAIREQFHLIKGKKELLDHDIRNLFHGYRETSLGFEGLFEGDPHIFEPFNKEIVLEQATLEDIMYFMQRRVRGNKNE